MRKGGPIHKSSQSYVVTKANAKQSLANLGKNLSNVIQEALAGAKDELYKIGEEVQTKSNEYAPKDTGELVDSSYITDEQIGSDYIVEVGYTAPHSVYQHELYGTSYKNPTTPGTKPKFLQSAATEKESEMINRIKNRLSQELS